LRNKERREVCKEFNILEKRIAMELIYSANADLPGFWETLTILDRFLDVKKKICKE
jgi:hypothetical protein